MEFEGSFEVNSAIDKVYSSLIDPNKAAKGIDDIQNIEVLSEDKFKAKVNVGISVIKGTVTFEFTIADKVLNKHAKLIGKGKGLGSSINIETNFDLSQINDGKTNIKWVAETDVKGLIANVGSKMVTNYSKKQIDQFIENLKQQF